MFQIKHFEIKDKVKAKKKLRVKNMAAAHRKLRKSINHVKWQEIIFSNLGGGFLPYRPGWPHVNNSVWSIGLNYL